MGPLLWDYSIKQNVCSCTLCIDSTCANAGYSSCCTNGTCKTSEGCYCDSQGHSVGDCCPDISEICPRYILHTLPLDYQGYPLFLLYQECIWSKWNEATFFKTTVSYCIYNNWQCAAKKAKWNCYNQCQRTDIMDSSGNIVQYVNRCYRCDVYQGNLYKEKDY